MALALSEIVQIKLAMGADSYSMFISAQCFTEDDVEAIVIAQNGNYELAASQMLEALADPQLAGNFKLGDLAGDLTDTYKAWLTRANMLRARNGKVDSVEGSISRAMSAVKPVITAWSTGIQAELANTES